MKLITLAAALLLAVAASLASGSQDSPGATKRKTFDHAMLSALLERHVIGDRVSYAGLSRDSAMLDAYTKRVAAVTPAQLNQWDREERFAFWINVYNAFTLKLIVDNYDLGEGKHLASITDLTKDDVGPWDQPLIPMPNHYPLMLEAGVKLPALTLNHIEQDILRPLFKDARLHAAVNCASISCPPLRNEAFEGSRLETQLEEQMTAFLGDESRNRYDPESKTLQLSKIFDWYGADFVNAKKGTTLADFVSHFAPESAGEDRSWIKSAKIGFRDYDWKLNDRE